MEIVWSWVFCKIKFWFSDESRLQFNALQNTKQSSTTSISTWGNNVLAWIRSNECRMSSVYFIYWVALGCPQWVGCSTMYILSLCWSSVSMLPEHQERTHLVALMKFSLPQLMLISISFKKTTRVFHSRKITRRLLTKFNDTEDVLFNIIIAILTQFYMFSFHLNCSKNFFHALE